MNDQYLTIHSIAMISSIALAYFVVILIAMHKLRTDYNPLSRYISEYAVGNYGRLATSSLIFYGIAILGIAFCLQAVLPANVISNIGLTLIAVWGLAMVTTSFFKTDLKAEPMSLHGTMHTIATNIGVASSMTGFMFLSYSFVFNESAQSIASVTLMIAIIALILTGLLFLGLIGDLLLKYHHNVPKIIFSLHELTGLTERLLVGISVVWLIVIIKFASK
ncbi:MAG TPA: DUF998 domain-containing protein [Desulfosporosinus sp.]|nr:DUF998 domain-containing protein [Desulfosporosinus sp.]